MNLTLLRLLTVFGMALQDVLAADLTCGVPADIHTGNAVSNQIFRAAVRRADLIGQTPIKKPAKFRTASAYGAKGDGQTDDTAALQKALDAGRRVWLSPNKVYLTKSRLELRDGMELISNGTSTILLAKGAEGFSNTATGRKEGQIYSKAGTGLLIQGAQISVRDVFVVKQYEDGKYVIGLEVRNANDVSLQRLRFRGFAIAPGIVTVRNSTNVTIVSSIVHASCTTWPHVPTVPGDMGSYQITGVSVDDDLPAEQSSRNVRIVNNVIVDLLMASVGRGDQTDGINFAGKQKSAGSLVEFNYVNRVWEALDIFGKGLNVRNNALGARGNGVKLIHQARDISIESNIIFGRLLYGGIRAYNVQPDQPPIPVENIKVIGNMFDLTEAADSVTVGAVHVESGSGQPKNIVFQSNRILVGDCTKQQALICDPNLHQCEFGNTTKVRLGVVDCE